MTVDVRPTNVVLVVDDDPVGRALVAALLRSEGHHVLQASDGLAALEQARTGHPDVVLLDVVMPGLDGFEVCERIRATPGIADVPILMITSLEDRPSLLRGLRAGADDFLSKPIDSTELRARIRTILRLNRYRRAAELADRLAEAYDSTLEGWVRALDLRDHETEGHTQRVTAMTVTLARHVGIQTAELEHVRRGALLHDIGKIGVPDAILHKAGRLTDEERRIIERHPDFAYQMLSPIAFLRPALDIPWCHHERWDGHGYPRRLGGAAVPLAARVFSIIDVWDAIVSERPYKRAMSPAAARAFLANGRRTQFDPDVVELFLQLEADGVFQPTTASSRGVDGPERRPVPIEPILVES